MSYVLRTHPPNPSPSPSPNAPLPPTPKLIPLPRLPPCRRRRRLLMHAALLYRLPPVDEPLLFGERGALV